MANTQTAHSGRLRHNQGTDTKGQQPPAPAHFCPLEALSTRNILLHAISVETNASSSSKGLTQVRKASRKCERLPQVREASAGSKKPPQARKASANLTASPSSRRKSLELVEVSRSWVGFWKLRRPSILRTFFEFAELAEAILEFADTLQVAEASLSCGRLEFAEAP